LITREDKDEWSLTNAVSGETEPYLRLTTAELEERLRKTGLWSEEGLAKLFAFEIGDSTPPPLPFYVKDGVAYGTKNGDIDPKNVLGKTEAKDGYYLHGVTSGQG
jgi:hypothetical protein